MIKYKMSEVREKEFSNGEWYVESYKLTTKENLVMVLARGNERMKCQVRNPNISMEGFSIGGSVTHSIVFINFNRFFKSEYFELDEIVLKRGDEYAKINRSVE